MWLGFSILILQFFFLETVKSEAISATITDWGENHECYPNRWSLEELWEDLRATEISQALLWSATGLSANWSFDEDCEKIKLIITCQDLQTQKLMLNGIEVSKKSEGKDRRGNNIPSTEPPTINLEGRPGYLHFWKNLYEEKIQPADEVFGQILDNIWYCEDKIPAAEIIENPFCQPNSVIEDRESFIISSRYRSYLSSYK